LDFKIILCVCVRARVREKPIHVVNYNPEYWAMCWSGWWTELWSD